MTEVMDAVNRAATAARMKRSAAVKAADEFLELLEPETHKIAIAGSIRRGELDAGDVEIVCLPRGIRRDLFGEMTSEPHDVQVALQHAGAVPRENKLGNRIAWGQRFIAAELRGVKLDVFCVLPPSQWGPQFLIRTGPAEYSRWIVKYARGVGYRFAGGRIVAFGSNRVLNTPTERDVFDVLGLDYVAPEDRPKYPSSCCGVRREVGGERGATRYYLCTKCGGACD